MNYQLVEMNPWVVTGAFGADRNRDGKLKTDGTVNPSERMRATEVARFNFYDPAAWMRFTE